MDTGAVDITVETGWIGATHINYRIQWDVVSRRCRERAILHSVNVERRRRWRHIHPICMELSAVEVWREAGIVGIDIPYDREIGRIMQGKDTSLEVVCISIAIYLNDVDFVIVPGGIEQEPSPGPTYLGNRHPGLEVAVGLAEELRKLELRLEVRASATRS